MAKHHVANTLWKTVDESLERLDPKGALDAIWAYVDELNKYIEDSKPWVLAKQESEREKLADFMFTLFESLRILGVILNPFLPETSKKILHALGIEEVPHPRMLGDWGVLKPGTRLGKSVPLFPKAEVLS